MGAGLTVVDKLVDTRSLLLEAAAREIHVRGFQAASVSRILAETGVTKGALYHHFASKLELGYAVFDECYAPTLRDRWIAPLRACREDPLSLLIEIIEETGAKMTDTHVTLGCPVNNLAQEMSPVDAGFRARIETLLGDWRNAIGEALTRAAARGQLTCDVAPGPTATFIVAALEGCVGMAKNAQKRDVLMQCGHGLIAYLHSLRNKPQ